eukprot:5171606-Pleurochrysis_carterae.AAC.1
MSSLVGQRSGTAEPMQTCTRSVPSVCARGRNALSNLAAAREVVRVRWCAWGFGLRDVDARLRACARLECGDDVEGRAGLPAAGADRAAVHHERGTVDARHRHHAAGH